MLLVLYRDALLWRRGRGTTRKMYSQVMVYIISGAAFKNFNRINVGVVVVVLATCSAKRSK